MVHPHRCLFLPNWIPSYLGVFTPDFNPLLSQTGTGQDVFASGQDKQIDFGCFTAVFMQTSVTQFNLQCSASCREGMRLILIQKIVIV